MKLPIYMDNSATTPCDPEVLEAMMPYLTTEFGHAASRNHQFGWNAERGVDLAREQIAACLGASPKEIIFTSGATESNNLALKGIAEMWREKGNHIITQSTEHKAVLDVCKYLERKGFAVTYLSVDPTGRVDVEELGAAITPQTILISIMLGNNEIGTVQPIAEIGKIAKARGILFHTDAAYGVHLLPFNVQEMGVDLASFSGHKVYGPKGIGALYVRSRSPRVRLTAQVHGGGHERGLRHGTLNVPGAVGMGRAFEVASRKRDEEAAHLRKLAHRLVGRIMESCDYVHRNGHPEHRVPGLENLSFEYVEGESFLMACKDVALASGSACTSATLEPSHVMRALGVGEELAHTSIRFTLGRFNTEEEVDHVSDLAVAAVKRLRELSPLYEMALEGIDLSAMEWAEH